MTTQRAGSGRIAGVGARGSAKWFVLAIVVGAALNGAYGYFFHEPVTR
jgi:hypothetical protein